MRVPLFPVAGFALCVSVLAGGCAAQHGFVERNSEPTPLSTEAPPPVAATKDPTQIASIQPPSVTQAPVLPSYPRTIQDSGASPAVISLYRKAQSERTAKQFEQALNDLERAVHIAPRDAFVWQALANINLDLKQPDQAEAAARKSNQFARGNPSLVSGNWSIIAFAKRSQGDAAGAAQAEQASQAVSGNP